MPLIFRRTQVWFSQIQLLVGTAHKKKSQTLLSRLLLPHPQTQRQNSPEQRNGSERNHQRNLIKQIGQRLTPLLSLPETKKSSTLQNQNRKDQTCPKQNAWMPFHRTAHQKEKLFWAPGLTCRWRPLFRWHTHWHTLKHRQKWSARGCFSQDHSNSLWGFAVTTERRKLVANIIDC